MDPRGIPLTGDWLQPSIILEQDTPNFTVGFAYPMYGLIVDAALDPPKPYVITVDDNGHFKILDIAKVRRA
jgi:hypothetical protein